MGCTFWKQFLKESVQDETNIELLREFFRGVLTSSPIPQHALLLAGPGKGKITIGWVLSALIGFKHVSNWEVDALSSPVVRARMVGTKLNISDFPIAGSTGADMFKSMVSGDRVSARDLYGDWFDYAPSVKFLFVSKQIPPLFSEPGASRRIVLIPFPATPPTFTRSMLDVLGGELEAIRAWALEPAKSCETA